MDTSTKIKEMVKDRYSKIARQNDQGCGCSCGCDPAATVEFSTFNDSYQNLEGYVAEADLGLGCGLPTEFAGIKSGDVVVDLGSGAGNDAFVARALVGESGRVIGVDMTEEMLARARANTLRLGYNNVEFLLGEIESLPLPDNSADVIISNCVLNLVPDKNRAFAEMYRVLKPGAHFCISDVVLKGELPENLRRSAEMYAGCVAGALQQDRYLQIIRNAGFHNVEIKKSKIVDLPDEELAAYLSASAIAELRRSDVGIFSITVVGQKMKTE